MLIFAVKFTGFRTAQETHLCVSMRVFLGRVSWGKHLGNKEEAKWALGVHKSLVPDYG